MIADTFVFIHISKTGGTSVSRSIVSLCEYKNIICRSKGPFFAKFEEQIGFYHSGHFMAQDYITILGETEYRNRFSSAFVRNPWDRVLSHYSMVVRSTGRKKDPVSRKQFNRFVKKVFVDNANLEEADPCERFPDKCRGHDRFFKPCTHWLEGGVDFVGRYENFQEGFDEICERIGVPSHELPVVNDSRNRERDYRPYYTDTSALTIEHFFSSDVEAFDYSFE